MLKTILKIFVAAIALFLVAAAFQPDEFRIQRSLVMKAAPQVIFGKINDFQQWEEWSPWAKLDPNATTTFEGADKGIGSIMRWSGNMQVGKGSMEIVESKHNKFLQMKLQFISPLPGEATTEFALEPDAGGTKVTWSMYGHRDYLGKAMGLLMNCDSMIGDKYEEGLANLKEAVHG